MARTLNVHLLPDHANPHDLAGHASVVIDVLRASTTIITALASGASCLIPCLEVEEAREVAARRTGALLGGERGGKRIAGFAPGNSPSEYTRERIQGKTIVFTTTNGTRALARCIGSARVLVGSFVNRAALCDQLRPDPQVNLLCAGTDGAPSLDDAAAAGAVVDRLIDVAPGWQLNDTADLCRSAWMAEMGGARDEGRLARLLARSRGGRNLLKLGMDRDLDLAAELDRFSIVPELDRATWQIRAVALNPRLPLLDPRPPDCNNASN